MSLVEMSLDDIIAQKRKTTKVGGRGGSRQGNRGRNAGNNVFKGTNGTRFVERGGQRNGPIIGGSNPNKMVRINLSNLAASVSSADLEELFGSYSIETATVHFNELGESCGTGDIYLRKKDALSVLRDFKGVALDGQVLNMLLVDGSSIRDRVGIVGERPRSHIFKRNDRQGGQRQNARGNRKGPKAEKSVADLDAELDAYMTRPKN